jgi:diguanylate cyclase (GGDEF)-like protein
MSEPTVARNVIVADDDPDLRDILRSVLESAGFTVAECENGERALAAIRQQAPELVIVDFSMPVMTGPELCRHLKQDLVLRHIPIIMLTGRSELQDRVYGIDSGADDYLVKPFEPVELLARVRMVLRRASQDLEANPLTKLPGNISIQREMDRRIGSNAPYAVAYVDLNRFKAFNDHYGFKRGDEVIQKTADVLIDATRAAGTSQDFVGHIGGDDFIVMTSGEKAEPVSAAIVERFDAMAAQLYDAEDRARGYLLHKDRKGQEIKVPLLSVSIALVLSEGRALTHPGQIAKIGAELKAYAKQFDRSVYVKERRTKPKNGS